MLKKFLSLLKPNTPKWSTPEVIEALSHEDVGRELAKKVADKLKKGDALFYSHRDYCGHGLIFSDGNYQLVSVYDGVSSALEKFNSSKEFINFLARQSDYSLAGADCKEHVFFTESAFELNNQRLTTNRLQNFTRV